LEEPDLVRHIVGCVIAYAEPHEGDRDSGCGPRSAALCRNYQSLAVGDLTELARMRARPAIGETTTKHTEYALAARFIGPGGNRIVILTPGGRNSGMLLTVRQVTSTQGLQELEKRLSAFAGERLPESFEALLSVTSSGQTDVAAEVIDVHAMPNTANASTGANNTLHAR
jgi:hypothetical protein